MVQYKRLNLFFADYTRNISKGGTFIKTERPLPLGTEFHFALHVPSRPQPFELRGEVVWVNDGSGAQVADPPGPGMAIRFVPSEESLAFAEEVDKMMHDSLGGDLTRLILGNERLADVPEVLS